MLLLGGFLEFLKKNIFVGTVFCTFGPFWMGLGLFQLLAASGSIKLSGAFPAGFTTYLAVYGVISILFWLGALRINVALVSTFSTLIVALFLLVGGQYGNMGAQKAGAWFGIITGFQAFYVGWFHRRLLASRFFRR